MGKPVIPTLSSDGWVTTPQKKFDFMMSHFFVAEYSQDYIFHQGVTSLPWIVQETTGDATACCALIQSSLRTYLERAFFQVEVDAGEVPTEDNLSAEIRIFINCVDYDGTVLNLGKILRAKEGMITEIVDIVNGVI